MKNLYRTKILAIILINIVVGDFISCSIISLSLISLIAISPKDLFLLWYMKPLNISAILKTEFLDGWMSSYDFYWLATNRSLFMVIFKSLGVGLINFFSDFDSSIRNLEISFDQSTF